MKSKELCIHQVKAKWTLETALDLTNGNTSYCYVIINALRSLDTDTFNGKVVAALRNEFGGHAVEKN